jgi:ABC-type nitrate/sulfonate/bicarbonate transport system substrate-binding protein
LFAENDLAPRFTIMDSGSTAIAALISGSVAFSVAGTTETLIARAKRQPILIVGNVYRNLSGFLVLAKDVAQRAGGSDQPVAARLKALNDLIIAIPSATSGWLPPFRESARRAGATIRFVYMSQTAMPSALQAGSIQGMIAGGPNWSVPVLNGFGVLWISGPGGELSEDLSPKSQTCLETTSEYAGANPKVIKSLQKILDDFATIVLTTPEKAKAAFAKVYPQLTPEEVELAFSTESKAWTRPRLDESDIRHEIRLLKAIGTSIPELDTLNPADLLLKV